MGSELLAELRVFVTRWVNVVATTCEYEDGMTVEPKAGTAEEGD